MFEVIDTGIGIPRRSPEAHLREVHPGRRQHDAQVRRHRPRTRDLAQPGRADGRHHRRPQRRRGQGDAHVLLAPGVARGRPERRRADRGRRAPTASRARPAGRWCWWSRTTRRSASSWSRCSTSTATAPSRRSTPRAAGCSRGGCARRWWCSTTRWPAPRAPSLRTGWDLAERMTTDSHDAPHSAGLRHRLRRPSSSDKLKSTAFARQPEHLMKPVDGSALIAKIEELIGAVDGRTVAHPDGRRRPVGRGLRAQGAAGGPLPHRGREQRRGVPAHPAHAAAAASTCCCSTS